MAAVTIKVRMECSEGTGHFYTTTKNPRNKPEKMVLSKYNPVLRRHAIYKEKKIK